MRARYLPSWKRASTALRMRTFEIPAGGLIFRNIETFCWIYRQRKEARKLFVSLVHVAQVVFAASSCDRSEIL